QVQDLRNVYEARIPGLIVDQEARKAAGIAKQQTLAANALAFSKQIPEFATGGTTMGGLAFLHPGEKVLNIHQQTAVRAMAGAHVFERAGVPGMNQSESRNFASGGTMPDAGRRGGYSR